MQHHARAGMITARGGGEDDEDPQAGDVAVLHVREVDVNLAGIPGNAGERPDQALVAVLVDLTGDEQPGLVSETAAVPVVLRDVRPCPFPGDARDAVGKSTALCPPLGRKGTCGRVLNA